MNTGVYRITCVPTGEQYIGSTTVGFKTRFSDHRLLLRKNKHRNRKLQSAWSMWGESSFTFEPLIITRKEDVIFYEQRCLTAFNPELNLSPRAGSCLGVKFSHESRMRCRLKSGLARHYDVGDGERLLVSEICDRTGLPKATIKNRIKKGVRGKELLRPKMTRHEIAEITHANTYRINGENLRIPAIAKKYGIPVKTVEMRVSMGWDSEDLGNPLVVPTERQVIRYEVDGLQMTLREMSETYGIPLKTLRTRRNLGKRGTDLVAPVQKRAS